MKALVRALALGVGSLPWRWLPSLGAAIGWLAGSVLRIRRAHVEEAMRVAGLDDPSARARAMYAALGASTLEFLSLAARGARALEHARVDDSSAALWRRAIGRGRGVVVAASHTGNWDLAACAMARRVELLVVTKRLRVRWLDDFWQSARATLGVRLVDARGALSAARRVLGRGGAVAMMIDQVPASARHSVKASFLGQTAFVDRGPAVLAAASGAPLVVAVSRREPGGEHLLQVLDVLDPPPRASRAWITQATVQATKRLEDFVRENPSQWLWLHRRWKALDANPCGSTLASSCTAIHSTSPVAPSRVV